VNIAQHRDRALERQLGFGQQRQAAPGRLQHELMIRPQQLHRFARELQIETLLAVRALTLNRKPRIHPSLLRSIPLRASGPRPKVSVSSRLLTRLRRGGPGRSKERRYEPLRRSKREERWAHRGARKRWPHPRAANGWN